MVSSKKTAFVSNPSMGTTPLQEHRRLRFSFQIHNVKDPGPQSPPKKRTPKTPGLTPRAGEPRGLAGADFDFKHLFIQKVSPNPNRNKPRHELPPKTLIVSDQVLKSGSRRSSSSRRGAVSRRNHIPCQRFLFGPARILSRRSALRRRLSPSRSTGLSWPGPKGCTARR